MRRTTYKRKREASPFYGRFSKTMHKGYISPYVPPRPLKRTKRITNRFIPGVDRTGGFYGRYSGRSSELKFHDVDLDDAVISELATITASVNLIGQGVAENKRVGRKCTIKSINWHWRISLPEIDAQMTPSEGETVRILMYLDKQCNGATIVAETLLEDDDYQSFRNLANSGRFQVLYDKTVDINYLTLNSDGAGVSSQAGVLKSGNFYKKCNIPLEFDFTTGILTEIKSNNIGVMLIGNKGVATFVSKIRLRFSDF